MAEENRQMNSINGFLISQIREMYIKWKAEFPIGARVHPLQKCPAANVLFAMFKKISSIE
jgi:hypothetical protein